MRIFLFILMQIAVLVMVSIVGSVLMAVLGIRVSPGAYSGLLTMCAIFGFTGSVISLFLSKFMCKKAYGVRVISNPRSEREQYLVNVVTDMARRYGFNTPEIGIYESADMNAFATGASKNSALVAVSSGLLYNMNPSELKGVIGHEMSHIENGDMVTMSLLQGVLNTFVYFFSYIAASLISNAMSRSSDENSSGGNFFVFHMVNMLCQIGFGLLANLILMWFSRHREYRADAGSATLGGKDCMIRALQALKRSAEPQPAKGQFAALCIQGGSSMSELFMSHPPLDKRIAALQALQTF